MAAQPSIKMHTKVVGVTKVNEDGRRRQEIISEDLYEGMDLVLEREPDNPYDPNAVAVLTSSYGDQVGYLNKDLAAELAPLMDDGQLVTATVADITGGELDGKTYGVNILITVLTKEETLRYAQQEAEAWESRKNNHQAPQSLSQGSFTSYQPAAAPPKLTLRQRWQRLPKKTRTWLIILAVIALIYLINSLTSCAPRIQEVIHTQEVEVTRLVTEIVVVTSTPPPPTPTLAFQKWTLEDAQEVIQAAGLEFEDVREMTKDDYGFAPMNALQAWRFIIPSLCSDCGGRIYSFDDSEKLALMKDYYEKLSESSAMFFSWTFAKDNILIQISGDLPEEKALRYQEALENLK